MLHLIDKLGTTLVLSNFTLKGPTNWPWIGPVLTHLLKQVRSSSSAILMKWEEVACVESDILKLKKTPPLHGIQLQRVVCRVRIALKIS